MIHLAIPRMAFEKVKENLLLLLKLMDMGGQKADADVHAQRHGMPPHPAQDPNIMALAAKLGIGGAPGGGMPPQGPPPSPMPQQPPGM
jgi:hypothetical protein